MTSSFQSAAARGSVLTLLLVTLALPIAADEPVPRAYVLSGEQRLFRFDAAGEVAAASRLGVTAVEAAGFDPQGRLFAIDADGLLLDVSPRGGQLSWVADLSIPAPSPVEDLTFDSDGDLWVLSLYGPPETPFSELQRFRRVGSSFQPQSEGAGMYQLRLRGVAVVDGHFLLLEVNAFEETGRIWRVPMSNPNAPLQPFSAPLDLSPVSTNLNFPDLRGLSISDQGRLFSLGFDIGLVAENRPAVVEIDPAVGTLSFVTEKNSQMRRGALAVRDASCDPTDTSHCLDDRFQVSVDFKSSDGTFGSAQVSGLTTLDSVIFSFFGSDNLEVMVKVLDGCAINGHYWVFAASATTLEHIIRVRDTLQNVEWSSGRPQGTTTPPVTNTLALSCE